MPSKLLLSSNEDRFCGDFSHESFGNSVKILDIDGDGELDIVVGAPRFSKKRQGSSPAKYDIGRVYIYLQRNGRIDDENPHIIHGADIDGQFGYSIEVVGDRTGDGIEV